ncbi:MAG: hypothetical protein ACD_2C00119G0004 [uncultured bacterium (gcode 4)]|uniref:DUF3800 domain-containing protein n=1 Tax=uncultured bacterium (gcode 4) TaxID=1234023 RepID=K2G3C3_9BACT|nr:MAG: hypothetical protein ACD_2C00119G0004 [uncultured bacterium (gcode 4)]
MYLIYLDESWNTGKDFMNARQPIHFISGILVSEDCIDPICKKLKSLEKMFSPKKIPKFEFHWSDMALWKGIFAGFNEELRIDTFLKILTIIEKSDLLFISQWIDKAKLFEKYKTPLHPHNLAFMYLVEKIDDFLVKSDSRWLLIMDNNEDRKQRVINDFSSFKDKETYFGYWKKKITNVIDSVYYTESYNSPLMQLADVIWYLHAYLMVSKHKWTYNKTQINKRIIFERLEKILKKKTYYSNIKPR